MKNYQFGVCNQDLNPQPLDQKSPCVTTTLGPLPIYILD